MTPGPLRRLVGTAGLLALVPTAVMLGMDRISPLDTALRAGATLIAVVVIGRAADWWVASVAKGLERDGAPDGGAPGGGPDGGAPTERRRASDTPVGMDAQKAT